MHDSIARARAVRVGLSITKAHAVQKRIALAKEAALPPAQVDADPVPAGAAAPASAGGVFRGIPVVIDRPRGHVMEGVDEQGRPWRRVYHTDYGYIPNTKGGDGEGIDVFLGGDETAHDAHWILQHKADGSFDEYKCILPGQELVGAVVGASKAFYTGQAVKLRSASGKVLSVTPNHPVLTTRGLVPAGDLKKGDHLLAYDGEGKRAASSDHEQHPPTVVEQVFGTLAELHPLGVARKLVAPLDFHGDASGFHGEVEVVRTYRELRGDVVPQAAECVQEGRFVGALSAERGLVRGGTLHSGFKAEDPSCVGATRSFPSETALLGENFGRTPRDAQAYRFGVSPDGDLALLKAASDRTHVNGETLGDVLRRLTGGVAPDKIVDIELVHYSGPVFDFESTTGLIVINRVVISNCMLGFNTPDSAKGMYFAHVPKRFFGSMVTMSIEMMKAMLGIDPSENVTKGTEERQVKLIAALPADGIQKAGDEWRYVLGIVLEPDVASGDAQGDRYSAETIRRAAWDYMVHFRNTGLMHKGLVNSKVRLVESYIAPTDLEVGGSQIKAGTWMMGLELVDQGLWDAVKSGALTGLSIGGFAAKRPA